MFYIIKENGWFGGVSEIETLSSTTVAPPVIPQNNQIVGQAFPYWHTDRTWHMMAYQEPIEVKQTGISKAAFVRLFGAEKFAQIIQATQTDIDVKAAYEYASLCDIVELDHPDTITYLGLLGLKGLLTTEQIQKISNNQPI